MKREDFTPCVVCGDLMGKANGLLFYRLTIQRMAFDHQSIRQISGLEMVLGSSALASVFAPSTEVAKPFGDPVTVLICDDCACRRSTPIAAMEEIARGRAEAQSDEGATTHPDDPQAA